jgi:hypothetical protein
LAQYEHCASVTTIVNFVVHCITAIVSFVAQYKYYASVTAIVSFVAQYKYYASVTTIVSFVVLRTREERINIPFLKKLRADTSQGTLAFILCRIFCFPVYPPKM